jgi:hypothetical protein
MSQYFEHFVRWKGKTEERYVAPAEDLIRAIRAYAKVKRSSHAVPL